MPRYGMGGIDIFMQLKTRPRRALRTELGCVCNIFCHPEWFVSQYFSVSDFWDEDYPSIRQHPANNSIFGVSKQGTANVLE